MQKLTLGNGFVVESPSLLLDIDGTFLPSMSLSITAEQQKLIQEAYAVLNGALAFSTGRDQYSVQAVFPDLPASVEHHAAVRRIFQGTFESLDSSQRVNSKKLADCMRGALHPFTRTADTPDAFYGDVGQSGPLVIIEAKPHGLALVFNEQARGEIRSIQAVAQRAYEEAGLQKTHEIKTGVDAVEIAARTTGKSGAVRLFMQQPAFQGTRPIFIGDSSADEEAMRTCYQEFNGIGIAVGPAISDGPHVGVRFETIADTWAFFRKNFSPAS